VLSLIIGTLIIIQVSENVAFAMSIDKDGEQWHLLMSLLGTKSTRGPLLVAIGLFGAACIYGRWCTTPAISVSLPVHAGE